MFKFVVKVVDTFLKYWIPSNLTNLRKASVSPYSSQRITTP